MSEVGRFMIWARLWRLRHADECAWQSLRRVSHLFAVVKLCPSPEFRCGSGLSYFLFLGGSDGTTTRRSRHLLPASHNREFIFGFGVAGRRRANS